MPRIAPDSFDQIVWPLTETSGNYRNVGTIFPNDPSTDLVVTNTVIRTGNSLFGGNCLQIPGTSNFPSGSSATRNYIAGAKTFNPTPPFTVSCWIYLRSYTTVASTFSSVISKEYRDSSITTSWTAPFQAINIGLAPSNGGGDWSAGVALNSTTGASISVTDFPIPLGVWSHIGMSYDGSNIRAFLNGCQTMYYSGSTQIFTAPAASISYTDGTNGFGFWRIGAITSTGSGNKEEPNMNIADVRIANIARPLSYFKNIYRAGALPIQTFTSAQYFKLRAYDTSCGTPTAVTWVDTQISLANAPPFPCSGPYTAPEVLETWYA